MGVWGLKSFLERNGRTRTVDIFEEINKWKSDNPDDPDQLPLIVFDFCSLTKNKKDVKDYICGGGGEITSSPWNDILKNLKAAGCRLVFYSDPRLNRTEEETLLEYSEHFSVYTNMYDRIDDRQTLQEISNEIVDLDEKTTYRELKVVACKFGELRYSVMDKCDVELAQYAYQHNAMAVISNDTNFLIYKGSWQLWWSDKEINGDTWKQLKLTEYIRNSLEGLCSLSRSQLPLFATLLGNNFTRKYQNIFYGNHKIQNISKYVRRVGSDRLTDFDIKRITQSVYINSTQSTVEIQQSIRESLRWYDIDIPPPKLNDGLAEKLINIPPNGLDMYRPYMLNMLPIYRILTRYYDMRGCDKNANLTLLLMDWKKRRVGVVRQRFHNDAFELTIWAKIDIDMTSDVIHIGKPIYPDFQVPEPLDDLYLGDGDTELIEIKWKIFAWTMSLPMELVLIIKHLPKDYKMISAILYSLVENNLISILEADGILFTEYKTNISEGEIMNVDYPTLLESRQVRAAHVYKAVFEHVHENFAVAGLLTHVYKFLNFDGVYFQNIMGQLHRMKESERDEFIAPMKNYRIYAADYVVDYTENQF